MKARVYIYGLCNVFYDGYYIQGIKEVFNNYEFNIDKFPVLNSGVFAFIVEYENGIKKVVIDSKDSTKIDLEAFKWCDVYGKVNYCNETLRGFNKKIIAIGPSFGIKIWTLTQTFYYLVFNLIKFRNRILNKKEYAANYWRQYKRLRLKMYDYTNSSTNEVFFMNSIWKNENVTNKNRALFMESCKKNADILFEGGFAARNNGDNLGFDDKIYSKKIPLTLYIEKTKRSALVFNTPAVLNCHGWKLAEFLSLGKAIISTSHHNELPKELENNKHLIYANNQQEIEEAIDMLIKDQKIKKRLEFESRNYFDDHLAPDKVIQKLILSI